MKRFLKRLVILLLLVLLAGGAAIAIVYARINQPYKSFSGAEQFVDIPQGAGSRAIGDRLAAAGLVRDTVTYRTALWMSGQGRHLKAGEYRFDRAMTPFEVIDKIARGDVFVIPVTFPEGLTVGEMAKIFESHGLGTAASFVEAAKDAAAARDLDPAAPNLEGYLFPDTYPVPRSTDAPKLVHLMVTRLEHVFTPALREAAALQDLSARQAVTLASIVEKETARAEERPVIAGLYLNRLRRGMPLQCDPTVIYALERAGKYTGNLRREDLAFDSAYNTYRYPGLPPGPIASPGRASLEAVAHPAQTDFLYFVSRNDGSHEFARTLEEHSRNVQKYQVAPFRSGGAGGAGKAGEAGKAEEAGGARKAGGAGRAGKAGKAGRAGRAGRGGKERRDRARSH